MPDFLADTFPDLEVVKLQTVPELDKDGEPVINAISGWPDSYFYDIDLALSVIRNDLIGWCPEAFTPESQDIIQGLPIGKIAVSLQEATEGMACNLVSTGETVIMSAGAPEYRAATEAHGLKTVTPDISELAKSGGCIRCTTLTLR
jgi:N-dimethylarginine dimethylaminohydrolase